METQEEQQPTRNDWKNRDRVMVLCSRGSSYRDRHLMNDIKTLMPHSKAESKFDKGESLTSLNEICSMRNCGKCIYLEAKKGKDLYMWVASVPKGPSVRFLVHNVHTMLELKLSGNCLKGSRPLLSFDSEFDSLPHWRLLKELFIQVFGVPNQHPKSQPFIDHVYNFGIEDDKIWFRNYQIVEKDKLEEIGPRMVLDVIKIFDGSFGGPVVYENEDYITPNEMRRRMKSVTGAKYTNRVLSKKYLKARQENEKETFTFDSTDDIFDTNVAPVAAESDLHQVSKMTKRKSASGTKTKKKRKRLH